MSWIFVVFAIISEVTATLSLKAASQGKTLWYIPVAVGYILAFIFLSFALQAGLPLGVVYGIWSATGVAVVAVMGRVIFKEPLTWIMSIGIACIAAGVVLVEVSSGH